MIRFLLILALSTSSSAPAPSDIPVSLGQARSGMPTGDGDSPEVRMQGGAGLTFRLKSNRTEGQAAVQAGGSSVGVPQFRASLSKPVERPGAWVAVDAGGATTETVRVTRHNAPQGGNAPRSASKRPGVVSEGTIRATWYCSPPKSRCTRGYPSGLYAAISPDLSFLRGHRVEVCAGACVTVLIVDCDCATTQGIDLYAEAFAKLAPLSRGVLTVTWRLVP